MKNYYKSYYLLVIIILIYILSYSSYLYPQQAKIIKRVMTESEFQKLKSITGTYEEGKNYNIIINGFGTGLVPPTEEEWEKMRNQPLFVDKIEYPMKKLSASSSFDNSATIWFPPIGHQGGEGSCVPWACVYYVKTFQEAKEHNWDLSGCSWQGDWGGNPSPDYQDKIFSPDFCYHLLNKGANNGISYSDNINLLQQIGCCTWDKMPNDVVDHTEWPTENAWRQAPLYRSQTGYGYLWINTDAGIEDLKQLLCEGNLAVISINADYFYENFTSDDLLNLDNYNTTSHNHANTIVGYDDNFGPYTESGNSNTYGAFKVANSWGIGSWENIPDGFYYISYECIKQRIQGVFFYQNSEGYEPKMVAVFEMNHNYRGENKIDFGILDSYYSQVIKPLDNFSEKGGNLPYPDNPIVIDITELIPYMSGSTNQFFMSVRDRGTTATGTIQYFSIEIYDDYMSGIPKNVYVSSETPLNTQQWVHTYVNLFTSPETISIIYPFEGEVLDIGSNPTIKFSSVGTSGYVSIDYSTDIGTTWNPVAENVIDNGEFKNWIVPNTPSGYCKIRISDADGSPSTISKGLFRIGPYEFTEQTSMSLDSANIGLWGDYDNDGNLDILLTWLTSESGKSKIYHNNGNNTFIEQATIPQSVPWGSAAWGDYDNDGDLDLLFTSKIYRNDGNNTFTEQTSISLIGVQDGSVAWGDYDNDGDLDILLTGLSFSVPHPVGGGAAVTRIYRNNGDNTFSEQTSISLIDVTMGSVAWGDYDNDGYLDILITGESGIGRIAKIYRSNGNNTFTEQTSISLIGVGSGSVVWGDYDNDGYLDILLTGASSGPTSRIYHNNGNNTFTEQTSIQLWNVWGGSVAWVDYDNDGDLDIFLNGTTPAKYNTKIYRNNGNNVFTEQTSIFLDNSNRAAWGDYDNDGDLDILLNGSYFGMHCTKIYRNNSLTSNSLPLAPSNLKVKVNGNDVTFSWDKSTDNETPQNGLTYNVVIGTSPGSCDVLSPMADLNTGKRRIVGMGNAGHCNSKIIKGLLDGKYFWSVQSIDNSYAGSNFAETKSFSIPFEGTISITSPKGGEIFTAGSNSVITYTSEGTSGYVDLDYSIDGGTTWDTIAAHQLDDGNYKEWIVPNTPSSNCKIRITDSDGEPSVISDSLFTIQSPGTITITYPTGGEIFEAGSNPTITYASLGNSGYVDFDYSIDNGATWDTIATHQPDDGDYNGWIVPNTPSTNCKIRIADVDGDPTAIIDSVFTITGIVPVELVSFTAKVNESKIILNWRTATETNNYGFELERKTFGSDSWENIGFIKVSGSSTFPKDYKFTDTPFGGSRFIYRLKQIDLNGNYEILKEIEIESLPQKYALYQNYPNPFNPVTNFRFQIVNHGLVSLKVYDILGNEIATIINKELDPGFYNYQWDAGQFPSGVYFYRLQAGNYINTKKLLLLK